MQAVVIRCSQCSVALTGRLTPDDELLMDAETILELSADVSHDDHVLVMPGRFVEADADISDMLRTWGVRVGDVLVHLDDVRNIQPGPEGRRVGCCGVESTDRDNLCCVNGHPVGTEVHDCWTPYFVRWAKPGIQASS
jgi:hypothetical protein